MDGEVVPSLRLPYVRSRSDPPLRAAERGTNDEGDRSAPRAVGCPRRPSACPDARPRARHRVSPAVRRRAPCRASARRLRTLTMIFTRRSRPSRHQPSYRSTATLHRSAPRGPSRRRRLGLAALGGGTAVAATTGLAAALASGAYAGPQPVTAPAPTSAAARTRGGRARVPSSAFTHDAEPGRPARPPLPRPARRAPRPRRPAASRSETRAPVAGARELQWPRVLVRPGLPGPPDGQRPAVRPERADRRQPHAAAGHPPARLPRRRVRHGARQRLGSGPALARARPQPRRRRADRHLRRGRRRGHGHPRSADPPEGGLPPGAGVRRSPKADRQPPPSRRRPA